MEDSTLKQTLITHGIKTSFLFLICVSLALVGCERIPQQTDVTDVISAPARIQAIAIIGPTSGSIVTGTVTFTRSGDQITVLIDIQNATPGLHGVHIHETGDCSAPDGTSAGGHWNPTDVAHGKWGSDEFHLGDIGNITVGEDGTGSIELTTDLWEIGTGSDIDVVGKGIIVHADADDFVSQPSGNAGARIGCGVIILSE